jgi:hypothetical protein
MPAIADPYGARPYDASSTTFRDGGSARRSPFRLRIRTALHRAEFTRALADGAEPDARPELALRAAQLTSDRGRRTLARTLSRTIAETYKPAMTRSRSIIIRRDAVLDAEDAINTMIERLRSSKPIQAQGMALAERILTNADHSPLYNPSEPGALRRAINGATEALDVDRARSHEFPIAA